MKYLCRSKFLLRERSSQVIKSFFFLGFFCLIFSWGHFSNLQISKILTIFLDRFNDLLLKWDAIIFSSWVSSCFRIFSDFLQILIFLQFWPYFFTQLMVYFSYMIWYDNILFRNFIRFPDFSKKFPDVFWIFFGFFPDFSRFSGFKNFSIWNKSLLCSRSRTLRI